MSKTDRDWIAWGKTDPYFGVITDDKYRAQNIARHHDEFMQGGVAYVRALLEEIERTLGPLNRGRALDFGCGVGRLTLPLADHFNDVLGLDIAPAMLAEAGANKRAQGKDNVSFELSDPDLSHAKGLFDLVHTFIVLQHIPVDRGLRLMGELLARVTPGGVASLHFSISRGESKARVLAYWMQKNIPGIQTLVNLLRGRPAGEPLMQMNEYPLTRIFEMLSERGFPKGIVTLARHGKYLTLQISARHETHRGGA